jgi:hypothetical protein
MYIRSENSIAVELSLEPVEGWEEGPEGVSVGFKKIGDGWVAPPVEVSVFQAKAALALIGKLAMAEAIIAGSGDPLMQLAWAEASVFRLDSPSIAALAPLIGLSQTQVFELFYTASNISA